MVEAEAIRGISVFADLPPQALNECAGTAVRRPLLKGESIFHQGDQPVRFHALLSGWVRILQAGTDGELSVIRFVGPSELFGSLAMFTGRGYPADATAATDSIELSWSEAHLRKLIDRHPQIAVNLVGIAAGRLAEMQERVREISTQRAEQRIANALLRLAQIEKQQGDAPMSISVPLVRKDVAALAGTTLYTASRVMSAWERRGILAPSGRRISIVLPERLTQIGNGA